MTCTPRYTSKHRYCSQACNTHHDKSNIHVRQELGPLTMMRLHDVHRSNDATAPCKKVMTPVLTRILYLPIFECPCTPMRTHTHTCNHPGHGARAICHNEHDVEGVCMSVYVCACHDCLHVYNLIIRTRTRLHSGRRDQCHIKSHNQILSRWGTGGNWTLSA